MFRRRGSAHGWTKHVTVDIRFQNPTFLWETTNAIHHTNFVLLQ